MLRLQRIPEFSEITVNSRVKTLPKTGAIELTEKQKSLLETIERRAKTSQRLAQRVSIVLALFQSSNIRAIAKKLGITRNAVYKWKKRWLTGFARLKRMEERGVKDNKLLEAIELILKDAPRSGAPAKFTPEQIVAIIATACEHPENSERPVSHWTLREIADEVIKRGIVETISPASIWLFLKRSGD